MPSLHTYKVFVSHAWNYNTEYYRLLEMLDAAQNFSYANYSVPEHDPVDAGNGPRLRQKLKDQMVFAEVVLILGGMYVNHSDWIRFEIDHALERSKPIIGIYPWGSERMPTLISQSASELVGWNTNSIVGAIRRQVYG